MTEAAGLYLHVPFCRRICPYCDFAVCTGTPEARSRYVDSLLAEIALYRDLDWTFDTIYFGGGTPSLLSSEQLGRIIEGLDIDGAQIFLEANPEDVTQDRVADWRALGVRTLSLGVQSLDAEALRFLGRQHDPEGARRATRVAQAAGFDTVSIDLIYGRPGQSAQARRRELGQVLALEPQHISCYQLTVHEGTPLARRALPELPEARQAELFILTHQALGEAGLAAYDVSNFAAAPAHRSRHNAKYWRHVRYLGLGPAAHSFDGRRRWWNARRLPEYRALLARGQRPVAGQETLDRAALRLEALMLGLRTVEGVDLGIEFVTRNRETIERCIADGQMRLSDTRLALTTEGLVIADGLAAALEI